ncbi:hypothetical protein TON_1068 [Thermococcus onnurineus NA1]|uniref:Uncharacterized protein n=1 Tax=Thermococcus onnurineus (strain NA1) TaxID=523850 RepID=B6YWU3_THEON|nr:hypothetical protein [Thermococcus onnurineus]ACJ16556.1 hypothetical protein TON_1068 [Thermococcus onnurineus NA1]
MQRKILTALMIGIMIGFVLGALFSYSSEDSANQLPEMRVCPIVDYKILEGYTIPLGRTISNETEVAEALERAYIEQKSPNYPLEILKELYRAKKPNAELFGISYVFKNNTLGYGRYGLRNGTTEGDFTFEPFTEDESQRIDGVGLITKRWAVIFLSIYDAEGANNVETITVEVPIEWKRVYYSGSGKIAVTSPNYVKVKLPENRRINYLVLAFLTDGKLRSMGDIPKITVRVNGMDSVLSKPHSSST